MGQVVGKGKTVSGSGAEGIVHRANDKDDVMRLLKEDDLGECILLADSASATAVVPLMAKVKGVICRSGGTTSHLAIVSREFGIAAIMGAEVDDPDELEGKRVSMSDDGEISVE